MARSTKRAVQDVPIFLDARLWEELNEIFSLDGWHYKTNRNVFHTRDRALICLLLLSGCRISEALSLKKLQFRSYETKIVLANIKTVKRNILRKKVTMPKTGHLKPFTLALDDWLNYVPSENNYVFPSGTPHGDLRWNQSLSRYRAHAIIKFVTGKFPHWYRGVCENIYGRLIFNSDAWKLKQFMGYKSLESTAPYVSGSWEEDEKRIYKI